MLWASNVLDEVAKLVSQGGQHLVFILNRLYNAVSILGIRAIIWTDAPYHQGRVSIRLSFAPGRALARWWTVCGWHSIVAVHRRACTSVSMDTVVPSEECQGIGSSNVIP